MRPVEIGVRLPDWLSTAVPWDRPHESAEDRMRLAIRLAMSNVRRSTGGPFGAVVFDLTTNLPVAAGVNLVEPARNAILHAEIVALMFAQATVGGYSLRAVGLPPHALTTSCEPCAMCLGALLWSGVRVLECGASRDDALSLGFDEGPVFPASYEYLERHGVQVVRNVLRAEATSAFRTYRESGGIIYNG
jgi:tRNA(Arg) A34 adenosine deaminase TadA